MGLGTGNGNWEQGLGLGLRYWEWALGTGDEPPEFQRETEAGIPSTATPNSPNHRNTKSWNHSSQENPRSPWIPTFLTFPIPAPIQKSFPQIPPFPVFPLRHSQFFPSLELLQPLQILGMRNLELIQEFPKFPVLFPEKFPEFPEEFPDEFPGFPEEFPEHFPEFPEEFPELFPEFPESQTLHWGPGQSRSFPKSQKISSPIPKFLSGQKSRRPGSVITELIGPKLN